MNAKSIFLIFGLLWIIEISLGQNNSFDISYQKINTEIIATDIREAIRLADSLQNIATSDEQKIKSLMLLATIHQSIGNKLNMLEYAKKAEKIASLTGFREWNTRVSGFLATNLRELGLESESVKYLKNAIQACEQIKDRTAYRLAKINILQEKAIRLQDNNEFIESIALMKLAKSLASADTSHTQRAILVKAINDQMLGVSYLGLGEFRNADFHFKTSLSSLRGMESNLIPYNYRGLAELNLQMGRLDSAKLYLDLSSKYIHSSDRQELKVLVYDSYVKYFKGKGKYDSVAFYLALQREIANKKELEANKFVNQVMNSLLNEQRELRKLSFIYWWLCGALLVLFILVLIYSISFKKNKKKHNNTPKDNIHITKQDSPPISLEDQGCHGQNNQIALETENRLILRLNELENNLFFLDHQITLNRLSQLLNTNQKYTSYIIKKYRKQDFNHFIMYSRIRWLIVQLKTKPELLDYKLSQIAALAGFSSHSKFAAAFKTVVGLTPSNYIENLSKGE